MSEDRSNGYKTVAEAFIKAHCEPNIGLSVVMQWAASLPAGGSVLDVGAGSGRPLTAALIEAGFEVSAKGCCAADRSIQLRRR